MKKSLKLHNPLGRTGQISVAIKRRSILGKKSLN